MPAGIFTLGGRLLPKHAVRPGLRLLLCCGTVFCVSSSGGAEYPQNRHAAAAPVTIEVCGESVTFGKVPERAITHDVNITELFLYMGLGEKLAGYSGIYKTKLIAPEYREQLAKLPLLSPRGLNVEAIVATNADFVFAGWGYGFHRGEITPETLSQFGIKSYLLRESCTRVGVHPAKATFEDIFTDMINLGRIFRIEAHAQALVERQRAELESIRSALGGIGHRPRVFVYDSGQAIPMTTGRYAITHAMIEAADGDNIFADLASSWIWGNWEDVINRNPEFIIIVDYDQPSATEKIDFLLSKPELADVVAIKEKRFIVLDYAEATPGPRNVDKVRALARILHPEKFP